MRFDSPEQEEFAGLVRATNSFLLLFVFRGESKVLPFESALLVPTPTRDFFNGQ
jgi:hypothetical protein